MKKVVAPTKFIMEEKMEEEAMHEIREWLMDRRDFLAWENITRDTIDVKRIYIDVAGDLVAGVMLSQIIFWHLPDREGNITKKRVHRNGHFWLVKRNDDWWEEARIKRGAACRALSKLEEKKLIITMIGKFKGAPTKHIRINWEVFLETLDKFLDKYDDRFTQIE